MNIKQQETFMQYVGIHYDRLKDKFQRYCKNQRYQFDEDVFENTIVKTYDLIEKKGLNDLSPEGIDNYLFMAFKQNTKREKVYYRNRKKAEIEELDCAYDDYYNQHNEPANEKIVRDLKEDFSVLYVIRRIEEVFPPDYAYCFKMKYLYKLTYKELQEKCSKLNIRNSRQKCIDVMRWAKENISKGEVEDAFEVFKGQYL